MWCALWTELSQLGNVAMEIRSCDTQATFALQWLPIIPLQWPDELNTATEGIVTWVFKSTLTR